MPLPKGADAAAAAAAAAISDADLGNECVVCMDAPRAVTLAPCNHHITCVGCTQELIRLKKSCPFCDKPIVEYSTAKWSTAR